MSKSISWKDWALALSLGLLCLGNIYSGKPFVVPNSAEVIGYDVFSLILWCLFLWSLSPFIRKFVARKRRPGDA
jgi:hypothetical protein